MNHHSTRPADTHTSTPTLTTEVYEAAFSTTGAHPMAGVALTRTVQEARQRLADMLIFCDPTAPATADITAFHPPRLIESYTGTAGDIFTQVNTGTPSRTVTARPLTITTDRADGQA
jgi:ribosomal protein S12 methylthiotransferase accessory factor YcaO